MCVLLVQRVVLATLLLVLLMIDLQLLSHLLYAVLLHQLIFYHMKNRRQQDHHLLKIQADYIRVLLMNMILDL